MDSYSDRRASGYFCTDNAILEEFGRELGVYGFGVYSALVMLAGAGGEKSKCSPAVTLLADMLNCSPRKVHDELRKLEALGLVSREQRTNDKGHKRASVYTLLPVAKNAKYTKGAEAPRRQLATMEETPEPRSDACACDASGGEPTAHDALGAESLLHQVQHIKRDTSSSLRSEEGGASAPVDLGRPQTVIAETAPPPPPPAMDRAGFLAGLDEILGPSMYRQDGKPFAWVGRLVGTACRKCGGYEAGLAAFGAWMRARGDYRPRNPDKWPADFAGWLDQNPHQGTSGAPSVPGVVLG